MRIMKKTAAIAAVGLAATLTGGLGAWAACTGDGIPDRDGTGPKATRVVDGVKDRDGAPDKVQKQDRVHRDAATKPVAEKAVNKRVPANDRPCGGTPDKIQKRDRIHVAA